MVEPYKDLIELAIPAKAQYVGVVRLTVSGIANRMGFHYDDIEDMKLALAEACTNAVDHAYSGQEGQIAVSFFIFEDRLAIRVSDEGNSFDISSVKQRSGPIDKDLPLTSMRERGLGLHLMETLMDRVEINGGRGVIVTMTKFIHRDEVEQDVDSPEKTKSHG
ncbi:serine/threonine-protein kinase RsbW [Marininema mesophilum]|uniref:Serine-protein kinase RsbW n=1 Tax=Marininema mesophilum TaxID=1048340 RepID=A0A1H3AVD1_9BACL|nr:anti-sigma B factor RsbW [Marininema mesophilum]SDX33692.1 serine/threonine-protein kinase RsbW [Marininema mesophilum]